MNNNITDKVLDAIRGDKPEAKWKFMIREYSIWLIGSLSIFIGSLSVSVVIYMIANNDWSMGEQISGSLLKFMFITLPYLWILIIVLLIVIAYYNFRHTKHGYHYRLMTLVMGSVLISVILGTAFYLVGFGRVIDHTFANQIPIYERLASPRRMIWNQAESGRLAGKIITINQSSLDLIDFRSHKWVIDVDRNTILGIVPVKDGLIRIIGIKTGNDRFQAERIMPFDMHSDMMRGPHNQNIGF